MEAAFNAVEAFFWIGCSVTVAFRSRKLEGHKKNAAKIAFPTLFLFGISDFVEMRTGAWWNPPTLMYFKGLCLFLLVAAAFMYYLPLLKAEK